MSIKKPINEGNWITTDCWWNICVVVKGKKQYYYPRVDSESYPRNMGSEV